MSVAVEKAQSLIREYNLSIPVDLESLLDKLDITLNVSPLESMSGFAYSKNGHKVIGLNKTEGTERKRFTLAHELGHMLLHNSKDDVVFDDQAAFTYFRNELSSTGSNLQEIEANAFAAEILMPAHDVKRLVAQENGIDLISDDGKIKRLAEHYKVSFTAMSVRVGSLIKA